MTSRSIGRNNEESQLQHEIYQPQMHYGCPPQMYYHYPPQMDTVNNPSNPGQSWPPYMGNQLPYLEGSPMPAGTLPEPSYMSSDPPFYSVHPWYHYQGQYNQHQQHQHQQAQQQQCTQEKNAKKRWSKAARRSTGTANISGKIELSRDVYRRKQDNIRNKFCVEKRRRRIEAQLEYSKRTNEIIDQICARFIVEKTGNAEEDQGLLNDEKGQIATAQYHIHREKKKTAAYEKLIEDLIESRKQLKEELDREEKVIIQEASQRTRAELANFKERHVEIDAENGETAGGESEESNGIILNEDSHEDDDF